MAAFERTPLQRRLLWVRGKLQLKGLKPMRMTRCLFVALLVFAVVPKSYSQEKQPSGPQETQPPAQQLPVKLQFLITEYDGTKKVASMPYSATGITSSPHSRDAFGALRVGARIPIFANEKSGEETYIDVGTNIDYWVWPRTDDRYLVSGTIELSSLYGHDSGDEPKTPSGDAITHGAPLLHQTRADFSIVLRDGKPEEALSVTDPITGRVFRLEVTADVMK